MNVETVARELLAAWNERDLATFEALLADDVVWYDPAMPRPPIRGRAAVRAFADAILRAFPDFQYEVLHPVCTSADGTRCTINWRITATHSAPLVPPGFAPTGRTIRQEGVDVLDVRDDRVVRIFTAFDGIAAAEQLLAVTIRPAAGSFRERVLVLLQKVVAFRARHVRRNL